MNSRYVLFTMLATVLALAGSAFALPPATAPAGGISGTVIETMNAAGYTYLQVDTGTAKNWVAIPETTVAKGAKVTYSPGMEMVNFHSKSLDRTFPTIVFSPGLTTDAAKTDVAPSAPAAADNSFAAVVAKEQPAGSGTAQPVMNASGGSTGAVAPFAEVKVDKAPGDNAYTVAEIFTNAKKLHGKTVKIKGKVVKLSQNIMGRNWIHLQDGSGDPLQNTHDLVATSATAPAEGEIVVVEGKLAADKDFGAGYAYAAIIEEAVVSK